MNRSKVIGILTKNKKFDNRRLIGLKPSKNNKSNKMEELKCLLCQKERSNKYYILIRRKDSIYTLALWGRMGSKPNYKIIEDYTKTKWNYQLKAKYKKGYKSVSIDSILIVNPTTGLKPNDILYFLDKYSQILFETKEKIDKTISYTPESYDPFKSILEQRVKRIIEKEKPVIVKKKKRKIIFRD